MNWHFAKTVWVTVVNVALACAFMFFLFNVWTETPLLERAVIRGTQVIVAAALSLGVILELRRSAAAWKWNVSAQTAAAAFPCAVFFQIIHDANSKGVRIDGIEAMLLVYGFWIFVACGVTWLLYSRANRMATKQ